MRRLLLFSPSSACHLDPTPDPANPDRITRTGYDAAGQAVQVQTAYNTADQANEVTAAYTNNGKVKTVTDGEGNLTRYDYDGHDRLGYTVFPSKTVDGQADNADYERYVHDANGNVTMVDQRDRKTISFAYDALNRVTDKIRQHPESDVAFSYDNLGRMTSASQPFNTLTFTYDALGRKLTEVGPHGTVRSEYDIGGRRTSLTWPDNVWVSYLNLRRDHFLLAAGKAPALAADHGAGRELPLLAGRHGADDAVDVLALPDGLYRPPFAEPVGELHVDRDGYVLGHGALRLDGLR